MTTQLRPPSLEECALGDSPDGPLDPPLWTFELKLCWAAYLLLLTVLACSGFVFFTGYKIPLPIWL